MRNRMKMKYMIFAALAALCMTACNENKQEPTPEMTTAAQTTAITLTAAADTTETAAVSILIPEITFGISTEAATAATTAAPAESTDERITITIPVLTTVPQYSVIDDPPVVPFPENENYQFGEDALRISPTDAARMDIERLRGAWIYISTEALLASLKSTYEGTTRSPIEIHVTEGGVFSAFILENWSNAKLIANGRAVIEDGEYVFRCDDGSVLISGHPYPLEPLNTLCVTGMEDEHIIRFADGVLLYDRQYRRAKEAPQGLLSSVRVSTLTGSCWEYTDTEKDSYRFRVYGADEMSGSFEFRYEGYMRPDSLYTTGKVFLEQGLDNTGKLRYYYCFYDKADGKERLILSLEAEDMFVNDEGIRSISLAECYHLFAAEQTSRGTIRFNETQDPGTLSNVS